MKSTVKRGMMFAATYTRGYRSLYLFLIFCCLSLVCPPSVHSQEILLNDEDNNCRLRAAYIIAGIAVIAVGAGIGYAASSSCSKKCRHSCSYSNYFNSCGYSSYSYSPYYSHHHHHYSSYFSGSSSSSYSRRVSNGLLSRDFPLVKEKAQQQKVLMIAEDRNELSGLFTVSPSATDIGYGQAAAFVQLPNGVTQHLGDFSFSDGPGQGLPFGPFAEEGTYTFGVTIERGSEISAQGVLCRLDIAVNDSTVESRDFMVSAGGMGDLCPAHYTLH